MNKVDEDIDKEGTVLLLLSPEAHSAASDLTC